MWRFESRQIEGRPQTKLVAKTLQSSPNSWAFPTFDQSAASFELLYRLLAALDLTARRKTQSGGAFQIQLFSECKIRFARCDSRTPLSCVQAFPVACHGRRAKLWLFSVVKKCAKTHALHSLAKPGARYEISHETPLDCSVAVSVWQ